MKKILKNRKVLFISLLLITMLSISLGYAYLSRNLNITGTTEISQNSWIFYFDNVVEKDGNVATENPALIEPEAKRRIDFDVSLEEIQDTYEFNVDIVNAGSLKGQVGQIIKSALTVEQIQKLEFDIRYEDGTPIKICDVIEPNSRKTITVRVRLKDGEKYKMVDEETIPLSFEITYDQYDENKTCEDTNTYSLTIDPGEGTYEGKTGEVTVVEGLYNGTHVNLGENPTLENYYFTYWELMDNENYGGEYEETINTVTIKDRNAYVLAHYESAIGPYSLTIDPNGGTYEGSTELLVLENLRNGYNYKLGAEPEKEGKLFKRWKAIVNNQYNTKYNKRNNSVTIVDKSGYLQAEYGDAIAKIVETNKLYSTIENAFDAAEPGQTILLLDDTEESPLNEKKLNRSSNDEVILDLGGHKVTGKLTNNDILTIINGTIENLNGIAAINNGTLNLGTNDDNVDIDNIKLIGKATTGGIGLQNKGIFNFYDGYLDAFIGLDGIFHGIPFEHYVFVDDDTDIDRMCQKVYVIERPTRVVAQSVNENGGVMFYYNLQKAFNTSAQAYESGRRLVIEAIKDIQGEYSLLLSEGKTAFFDLKGYTVSLGDLLKNDGNLTITDTGNKTTGEKGILKVLVTMENTGNLNLKDVSVSVGGSVNLLNNKGDLNIQNSTLSAENGYVMEINDGKSMTMDSTTTLKANTYALLLTNPNPFTITGGNIEGIYNKGNLILGSGARVTKSANGYIGVYNYADNYKTVKFELNGGTIELEGNVGLFGIYNDGPGSKIVTSRNGTIKLNATRPNGYPYGANGIYSINEASKVEIIDINMIITSVDDSDVVNYYFPRGASAFFGGMVTIHDGNFVMTNNSTTNNGGASIFINNNSIVVNGGYFETNGKVATIATGSIRNYPNNSSYNGMTINDGTFVTNGINNAVLFDSQIDTVINDGKYTSSHVCFNMSEGAKTVNGGEFYCETYGVVDTWGNNISFTMTDGLLKSKNNTIHFIFDGYNARTATITGGRIISEEGYGIYSNDVDNIVTITSSETDSTKYPYIEGATTGIYMNKGNLNVDKAVVVGKKEYGVLVNGITTIGNDEGNITNEYPSISGDLYGLYINSGATSLYDGIYKGHTYGYYGFISGLPDAGEIANEVITDVEPELKISYIDEQDNFLKIIRDDNILEFNSLQRAVNAAEDGETIIVDRDHDIKSPVTIPSDKKVTIDFQNKTLAFSKQLINNGDLTLTDTVGEATGGMTSIVDKAIENTNKLTINAGNYVSNIGQLISNSNNFTLNGGKISVKQNIDVDNFGILTTAAAGKTANIELNGGLIEVESSRTAYGLYNTGSGTVNTTVNDVTMRVKANSTAGSYHGAVGVFCTGPGWASTPCNTEVFDADIKVESNDDTVVSTYSGPRGAMVFALQLVTIHDGTFEAKNNSTGINGGATVIYGSQTLKVTINGGTFITNGKQTSSITGNSEIRWNGGTYINGGTFESNGTKDAENIGSAINAVINSGDFYSKYQCVRINMDIEINGGNFVCDTYGVVDSGNNQVTLNMTGGTIRSKNNAINYAVDYYYGRNLTMTGGKLISEEGYGIYSSDVDNVITINSSSTDSDKYIYIEGATTGIYINKGTVNIDKAVIVGKNEYGIYSNGIVTLGHEDDSVSKYYPIIQGENTGVYLNDGSMNIYDGVLKGINKGYTGFVSGLQDGYAIVDGTEEINNKVYKTNYLEVEENFLKNKRTEVLYNSLQKAINESSENDIIEVLYSHDIKNLITIPSDKKLTIDFQNNTLPFSKQLINNGDLTLTDTVGEATGGMTSVVDKAIENTNKLTINAGNYVSNIGQLIANTNNVTINGGKLSVKQNIDVDNFGILTTAAAGKTANIELNGGLIEVESSRTAYGLYNTGEGTVNTRINDGTMRVKANSTAGSYHGAVGVFCTGAGWGRTTCNTEVFDADIKVESNDDTVVSTYSGPRGAMAFVLQTLTIHAGTIEATNRNNSTSVNGGSTIVYAGNSTKITINGGTFITNGKQSSSIAGDTDPRSGGGLYINGGTFESNGTKDAENIGYAIDAIINSGDFYSKYQCIRINRNIEINGGNFVCDTYGVVEGGNNQVTLNITGGTIRSKNNAINYALDYYNGRNLTMTGGKLISEEGYGIYSNDDNNIITINPNSETASNNYPYIEGALSGIYMNKGTLNIGQKDDVINLSHATITGGEYGLFLASGTTNNFYDGKLKGTIYGYNFPDGSINNIENGTYIHEDEETIEGTNYLVNYLKELSPIVQNTRTEVIYNDLQKAFNESKNGDLLKLIDDVQLFYPVTINKDSDGEFVDVTLELDGYDIKTTNTITINNGASVEMINNHATKTSKIYTGIVNISVISNSGVLTTDKVDFENTSSSAKDLIATNNGGNTTINNSTIKSVRNIHTYSGGETNINNSSLKASDISIHDEGTTNANNCIIESDAYGVYSITNSNGTFNNSSITGLEYSFYKYNGSSIQTLTDTDLLKGRIYNDRGTLNIVNDEKEKITINNINQDIFITNKATTYIKGANITENITKHAVYYYDYTSINNTGSLTLENSYYKITSSNNGSYVMFNNSGTLSTINTNLEIDRAINHIWDAEHNKVYGIYNTNSVNMKDGSLYIYDTSETITPYTYFYGIRNFTSAMSNIDGTRIEIDGGVLIYDILHESSSTTNELKNIDFRISNVATGYGIYMNSGTMNVQSGSIQVGVLIGDDGLGNKTYTDKNVGTAYGIYVNQVGTNMLLGVKDESINGGTLNADVSIENPLVIANGSTLGIGVKKYDGYFRFYDGIIMGNTEAKPDITNETNHINFGSVTYYDDEINYEYCVLEHSQNVVNKNNMSASMKDVYYKTINAAINRSNLGDTVIVQSSLEQNILIPEDKEVIVDLNNHILSGTITNNGIATLKDGEITTTGTSYETAITNNGILTIGIEDNRIIDNYVIILGNTTGLKNNGKVYMYDGYIRATTPVTGNSINTLYNYQAVQKEIDGYETVVIEEIPNANITESTIYNYEYDEDNLEQTFVAPESGYYKLETWGAQGGSYNATYIGGYGAYAKGIVYLEAGDTLYINVGSQGENACNTKTCNGGYNGGGSAGYYNGRTVYSSGGGGATHIATSSGLLSTFEDKKDELLIVAGGGGGATYHEANSTFGFKHSGGSGGGIEGSGLCSATDKADDNSSSGCGGNQNDTGEVSVEFYGTKGSFGQGASNTCVAINVGVGSQERKCYSAGGGGGLYGGSTGTHGVAGGGSGYIGNSELQSIGTTYKTMYGYGITTDITDETYTISTNEYSTLPEANKTKAGDGYARITKLIITES